MDRRPKMARSVHPATSSILSLTVSSLGVQTIMCYLLIEFRCVVTVSTPAVWLARESIKRLTPRPCINVEYTHGVVTWRRARRGFPHIR